MEQNEIKVSLDKVDKMTKNVIERNIKNYLKGIGADGNNKKRVDIWLMNKTRDDIEAKAQDLWLSSNGEVMVSLTWCDGHTEPYDFMLVSVRWWREILWELVLTKRITELN